ncbi:hypothetical protein ACHAWC_006149 [Mediolabrus comicus]
MATMMRQQEEEEGRRTNIAWPNCTICRSDYDNDHIPIVLICCGQSVCLDCFQKHQANQVIELDVNEIWYSCPISNCRLSKNTGFNRSNKCYVLNRSLMDILRIDVGPSNDSSAGVNDATNPSSAVVADKAGSDEEDNMIGLSHDADDDVVSPTGQTNSQSITHVLRRSQRIRRSPVSRDIADATRNVTMHRDKRSSSANERNTRRRVKRRTAHNHNISTTGVTLESPRLDREFSKIVRKAKTLWCIRQFIRDSRTDTDRLGRNPSEWALDKGYILASDRPLYAAGYPENPMKYLRETDIEDIKNTCRNASRFFSPGENLPLYCGRYKDFAAMEKGDMVVLNVPGRPKQGEAYFGVVTSNSLRRLSPSECREEGFPAMRMLRENYTFNGLMFREVKWLRKGLVRKLPGQKKKKGNNGAYTVPWINESAVIWLTKSKAIHSGLEIMKRSTFMENTSSV